MAEDETGLLFPVADSRLDGLWLVNCGSLSKGTSRGDVEVELEMSKILRRSSLSSTSSVPWPQEPSRGATGVEFVVSSFNSS